MATSKLNIFHTLARHDSDSEDEGTQGNKRGNNDRKNDRSKNDDKPKTAKNATQGGNVVPKDTKEEHLRQKEPRKDKHVTSDPHPLDRHSGSNTHAYGNKPKKAGAGKGNWGKTTEQAGEEEERAGDASPEVKAPVEEEKPSLTLEEYYKLQKKSQNEPQVNEAKAKITSEHLKKELGNSTLLKSRNQEDVDDRKVGKKRGDKIDVDHRAALNTEYGDLLGFRTGFVEKEYKKRDPEDAGQRRTAPRTGGKPEETKQEEAPETTEGTTTATATTTTGQEETATPTEGQTEGQTGERRNQGERRGGNRGNYRGGNRGGNRGEGGHRGEHRGEGGHRGEHREGGNRGGYRGGNQGNQKPVVTDESAFPKLG